ncbi:MAG TPA: serine hydrolase [Candidatus Saccharimonadales bacterium]|nr:serine hydrolase [Candidatus Saccharimonadales bacterium]
MIRQKNSKFIKFGIAGLAILMILGGYGYWALHRPLPYLRPQQTSPNIVVTAPAGSLTWPKTGQQAIGLVDGGTLQTHGKQTPVPTASTAKLITALMVLRDKPVGLGQTGPTITLTASDVALYQKYAAQNGSVVRVVAGEKISEYQMLQALMLPSANNVADSLAVWAYGSLPAYAKAANSYLATLNLQNTHVGSDASGLDPSTTSTASDLVLIGQLAMQNPVLAQIVGQKTATIPVAGKIKNVNFLLGTNHIVGIKTGNSDQAGGVFVSAVSITLNGDPRTLVIAYAGAPSLYDAVAGSLPMIQSAQTNFKTVTFVKKNTVIGHYKLPWGGSVAAVVSSDLNFQTWAGTEVGAQIGLGTIPATSKEGQIIGSVATRGKSVEIKLAKTIPAPSAWWRLTHPFN